MKQFFPQILRVMPYIFWALVAIVTVLMLIELAPKEGGWPYWDKLQHAAVFLVLAVAGCLAFPKNRLLVCLSLVAFGAIIEVLQGTLTTTRTPSVYDWLADIAGIVLAAMILVLIKSRHQQNNLRT
jgi:VanZ family protein